MTDKEIKTILTDDYKYLKTIYPQDRILGVFTYGKAAYGFAETIEDIQVKMYYVPSLEDICLQKEFMQAEITYNNHSINIKDIRLIFDNILQQEGTAMECFFSPNYIITPKFKKVFIDNIINKREEVFHCNPQLKIQEIVDQALNSLEQYKITNNSDDLFEACRKRLFCELYLQETPIQECIRLNKDYLIKYLQEIKNGAMSVDLIEIEQDLLNMVVRASNLETHPEEEDMIKDTLVEIMKIAFSKTISKQDFLTLLTETEVQAFKNIIPYLEMGEGYVSISKLTDEDEASRSVYKSLIRKLKDNDIATVKSSGAKGTYIKIIDGEFLDIDNYID